jgi:hypothetical protein
VWTLALRGGARVAVVAAEWCDAFGVARGRVQLELRDGEPGPVFGRGAGFWLRRTGVRALRNPGRPTDMRHSRRQSVSGDGDGAGSGGGAGSGPGTMWTSW